MPRRDILLDDLGNRLLLEGDYGFADGVQAVKQGIQCRLRLLRGENWLDQAKGVDWQGTILVRKPNPIAVRAELATAIADTPDVTRVGATSYAVNSATRLGSVTYDAASTEGLVAASVLA